MAENAIISLATVLNMAVKAMNDIVGPSGFIPALLVNGSLLYILVQLSALST